MSLDSNLGGRSVFITGHTGFKGGWLTVWLHGLGALVHGFALAPPTIPSLFDVARIGSLLTSDTRSDVADLASLVAAMRDAQPEFVCHLAAQPIVRESYRDPIGTIATNVIGTTHVLEAVRRTEGVRAVVVVTTDKVYENRVSTHRYRESDALGGHDPYSASKAAAEIIVASYRSSFFSEGSGPSTRIATARAGNVIGGGDWARDRLAGDCLRAFETSQPVQLRFPNAVRPWQHVLEPLSGYLRLAGRLTAEDGEQFAGPWNFGPDVQGEATVAQVADEMARRWGDGATVQHGSGADNPHEAALLTLDITKARSELNWRPRWSLTEAIEQTVGWHRAWRAGADMLLETQTQIEAYQAADTP